ncbi:signal peptide peptidase-like 2B-like protein [Willisornis vidua]|uniref:Signal peptide peptidase-like 2B-like protein n=1 Tax=Willisornis vidua TaxID=1566151 RepID=A0ABQ9DIW9_9PASS|nr:signal peptide peptidase-like 2B-like protein [Willisornis vidua]
MAVRPARLRLWLLLLVLPQVYCEYGMVHVLSEKGSSKGKDYCILFNSQWAHLPHDLGKADQTASVLCSPSDVPDGGFNNQIPMVMRGNCTFYEKVRLAQINGARGLLIVSRERLVPPGGNRSQYEEIDIPVALLSYTDMLDIGKSFGSSVKGAMYAPNEPVLDYNMVIIFVMAVGTVAIGGYWAGSRDVKKWAWVLQDALGIAFCLYMLKTIRLPTFKTGESIMVEVAAGPSDSATHEKLPMVLKVPRLNSSPLALCDRPFSLLGFGDILVPGLLVAYCHRFDIQVQSSRVYFVACTIAYGIGLLVTFVALALMQMGQPALLYLVPCTLLTSFAVALWRRELAMFWTGSGFAKDLPQPPVVIAPVNCPELPKDSNVPTSQQDAEQVTNPTLHMKELRGHTSAEEELADTSTKTDQSEISVAQSEEPTAQNKDNLESKCLNAEQSQRE